MYAIIATGGKQYKVAEGDIKDQTKINDIEANKVMAVISYLGILIIIPLLKG